MRLFLWKMLCRRESQGPQFRTTRFLDGNVNDQVLLAGRKPGARGLPHQPRQTESRAVHQRGLHGSLSCIYTWQHLLRVNTEYKLKRKEEKR